MSNKTAVSAGKSRRLNAMGVPAELMINVILILFCALCVVPFIFVIVISFSSTASISHKGFSFIPDEWSVEAYNYVFAMGAQLWRSYFNSFFITIVGTALSVIICILYSYALFRPDFKYRNFFTFFSFFTMLFGGGLAPTYMVCTKMLGLQDNYAALIVPMLVNPFNIIIMRTFFQSSVPTELIESASIDGSGEYRTLFNIIVPVAKPGIATVALLNMLAYWNEWFIALLYIKKPQYIPLQYLLMKMQREVEFLARNSAMVGPQAKQAPTDSLRMVLVVLIVVPIACAYPFFQRFIISGLTIGSVKG